jgi:hypothetical protein
VVAAEALTREDLVGAYRHLRGREPRLRRRKLVERALPGLLDASAEGDDCGEGRLDVLRHLLDERGGTRDLDGSDADDLPAGATVHWFFTDRIRVKYTTDATFPNDRVPPALPTADAAVNLSDGTTIGTVRAALADLHPDNTEVAPAYVQQVGIIAEHALGRFLSTAFGMRDPRNGAARLEFRVRQQAAGIAGQTSAAWSHVEVGPANGLLQNLHTVPHEMFHQVQYRYNATTTRSGIYTAVREGGARLIEDSVNDRTNRYVDTAQAIFSDPSHSLADSTSVAVSATATPIGYATGLFWKYLAEHHSIRTTGADEPAIGLDTYRRVLEATASAAPGAGYEPTALRTARAGQPWYGHFDQFGFYDVARTELDSHETTWGNYLIANLVHGSANPVPDRRFDYIEDEDQVTWSSPVAKLADLAPAAKTLTLVQGSSITEAVAPQSAWAARYYRIVPSGTPAPRVLRVAFAAGTTMTDPLVQIVRLGPGGAVLDVHRSDTTAYTKTIDLAGVSSVCVIVASRSAPGGYTLQLDEVAAAADTMITRWNSVAGTEYEVDPRGWSWTWVSPDVMVDNDGDGLADGTVFFGQDNALKVRLRNRGNQAATGITIDFWYQKATPHLSAANWIPLRDLAGTVQQITGATLAPGAQSWFGVDWAPVDDGTHHEHWCVKVHVTATGETNQDNKVALSNFAHVVPDGDGDRVPFLLRLPARFARSELHAIARGPRWTLDLPAELARVVGMGASADGGCGGRRLEVPVAARLGHATAHAARLRPAGGAGAVGPQAGRYYPVDPDTLPPGADPRNLVTIAHVIDGRAVGGVTYQIAPR